MKVTFPEAGSAGVNLDALAYEAPPAAWTSCKNMRFGTGYAERFAGHDQAFGTLSSVPYAIFGFYSNVTRYVVYCDQDAVYAVVGGTHTDITGTAPTGGSNDVWTGGVLPGGMLVLNNEADEPMYWTGDTGANLATLTGWDSNHRCKSMRVFKNFIFAVNVTKSSVSYDRLVMWSSSADVGALPTSWTPSSTNDAGETDLSVSTPLVDAIEFGDSMYIFSEGETVKATYIGPPFIFNFQVISRSHGLLAQRCATTVPGVGVFAVTHSDVVVHTGSESSRSVVEGRVKDYLFSNMSPTYYERTFVSRNLTKSEVWICYPSTASNGECDKALVWNFATDTWGFRDLPNVTSGTEAMVEETPAESFATVATNFDTDTMTFSDYDITPKTTQRLLLSSASNEKIYSIDSGLDFDGTDITARIERTGLALGAPDKVKTLRSIRPRVDAVAGTTISVYAGGSFDPEGDVTWQGPFTYTVGTDLKVDALISGRYLAVRFETTGSADWRLRSFDLDVVSQGDF